MTGARPWLSSARRTRAPSMSAGSSTGISTKSKPMRLILGKSATVSVVKGEVQSQVLTPKFMGEVHTSENAGWLSSGRTIRAGKAAVTVLIAITVVKQASDYFTEQEM